MTEGPPSSFTNGPKRKHLAPHRKAQVTSGLVAAAATLAPLVLSMRGSRAR